jgi:hypothetical protein
MGGADQAQSALDVVEGDDPPALLVQEPERLSTGRAGPGRAGPGRVSVPSLSREGGGKGVERGGDLASGKGRGEGSGRGEGGGSREPAPHRLQVLLRLATLHVVRHDGHEGAEAQPALHDECTTVLYYIILQNIIYNNIGSRRS